MSKPILVGYEALTGDCAPVRLLLAPGAGVGLS